MMNKNLSDEQTIFYAKEVISLLKIVSSEMDKIDEWKDEGSKISWTIGGQLWNVKNSK